ncbi:MAG TPA: hypothetical protein VM910_27625 [Bradyrhizobium sp.]|jgi:hypothetical protein|nr:hypothetical protein [Bradyrhizobium sp.]
MKPLKIASMTTTVCKHQDRLIAESIAEAKAWGASLRLTEAARIATGAVTVASIDATSEQYDQWAQQYIRLLFFAEGTRCAKCGHVATGPLTHYSAEDAKRWQRADLAANTPVANS